MIQGAGGAVVAPPGQHLLGDVLPQGYSGGLGRAVGDGGEGGVEGGVASVHLARIQFQKDTMGGDGSGGLRRRGAGDGRGETVKAMGGVDGVDGVVEGDMEHGQVAGGLGWWRAVGADAAQGRFVPGQDQVGRGGRRLCRDHRDPAQRRQDQEAGHGGLLGGATQRRRDADYSLFLL